MAVENPFRDNPDRQPLFAPTSELKRITKSVLSGLKKLNPEQRAATFELILAKYEELGDFSPIGQEDIKDHFRTERMNRAQYRSRF